MRSTSDKLSELFEHLLRGLVVGMDNAQFGCRLNQLRLRLQDRRERLVEIGRHLVEISAVFGLRRQAQETRVWFASANAWTTPAWAIDNDA